MDHLRHQKYKKCNKFERKELTKKRTFKKNF